VVSEERDWDWQSLRHLRSSFNFMYFLLSLFLSLVLCCASNFPLGLESHAINVTNKFLSLSTCVVVGWVM